MLLLFLQYWCWLTSKFLSGQESFDGVVIYIFSLVKYGHFVRLVRRICRAAGRDLGTMTKYAVEISLITVGIVGIGFISEAVLCVEYIQGTRLALIKADSDIAAVFALFSIMKRKCKQKILQIISIKQYVNI